MRKTKKILIIRFSAIGDIVLSSPIIRCIKAQMPNAEIHYCTKPQYAELVKYNPHIDKVHYVNESLRGLIKELKKEKFDFIADLHNSLRSKLIRAALFNVKSKHIDKINFEKWLMVKFKINRLPKKHVVDRYFDVLKPLHIFNDENGLEYHIPEKDELEPDWLPKEYRGEYYVFAIGATYNTKKLPKERIIQIIDSINKPFILIGGPAEAKEGEEIERFFTRTEAGKPNEPYLQNELDKKAIVFNGCGKFNLNQSAFIIKYANEVHAHDTGMMHVAAALKKKIVSYWGNTIPEFGMYPYQTRFSIIQKEGLSCRPCSKLGHATCPEGHFKCMT